MPLWYLAVTSLAPDVVQIAIGVVGGGRACQIASHSLVAVALVGAALASFEYAVRRDAAGALGVVLVCLSHLAADFFTGAKPWWGGGPDIGLELYSRPRWDFALELAVVASGAALYRRTIRLPGAVRRWSFWFALALLVLLQAGWDWYSR